MKTGTIAQLSFILAAAVAVFCFIRSARNDQRQTTCSALCAMSPAYAGRDRLAPDFELPDLNGKMVKLSSYRGQTVFLNFWTKTCGPCLREMPVIAELASVARSQKNMAVVTVTIDEGADSVRDTLKVLLNSEIPFPVLLDADSKVVLDRYGTRLFPETWVIDPKGVIRARFDAAFDEIPGWSESLLIDFGKMVQSPGGCPVEFFKGKPRGAFGAVCGDES